MKNHTTKTPAEFPVHVTGEPTNITIYMEPHNGTPRFMVSYYDAACQRHRRRCSSYEKADALAEKLRKEIKTGGWDVLTLRGSEKHAYERCREWQRRCGKPLDFIVHEYVDERRSFTSTLDEPRLRTRKEATQFLKVSVNTVDRLRYQRALPYYRIGGTVRFGPWDLVELISGKPVYPEQIITNTQRTLTKQELARFLCVSGRTVEHLIQTHGLWRRRVGRSVRFLMADVLSQLAISFRVQARAATSTEPPQVIHG